LPDGRERLALLMVVGLAAAALAYGVLRGRGGSPEAQIELSSTAFEDGGVIPMRYTCDGDDVSPPLEWKNLPEGTVSLALVVFDPDAPGGEFTHWLIYGIPARVKALPEGVPSEGIVAGLGVQGRNDFGRVGYGGPCPPPGPAHRYIFRLLALDADLDLPLGPTRGELEEAVEGHVLGVGELVGLYSRP